MQNKSFSEYRKARFGKGIDKPMPKIDSIFTRRLRTGGNPEWNKRAKAEYGKTIEPPVDKRALRDNVDLIQQSPTDPLLLTPKSKLDVDTLQEQLAAIPVKKDATKITVNKHGWADLESYRKKKDDTEFITNTQDYLIDQGWDIISDGDFGNKTYSAMNQYLVNKKLENYSGTNFTEDQFYDQIYKESHGKNNKVSPRGAIGLAQFMPSTFAWAKEKGWIPETAKITDPAAQSLAQRKYMDHLFENIDNIASAGNDKEERQARAFAAYNHGPDNFNEFWGKLTKKQKEEGWKTWYKLANDETQKYVLWMMDKSEYKRLYNTPETRTRKDGTTFQTSKWNDVYYGYENWRSKNHIYRYKYGGGVPKYNYGGSASDDEKSWWSNLTNKAKNFNVLELGDYLKGKKSSGQTMTPEQIQAYREDEEREHGTIKDGMFWDTQYKEDDMGRATAGKWVPVPDEYKSPVEESSTNSGNKYTDFLGTQVRSLKELGNKELRKIPITPDTVEMFKDYGVDVGDILHISDIGFSNQNSFYIEKAPPIMSIDPITDIKQIPVEEEEPTLSKVEVPEFSDIESTVDAKFHHRKFKEVDGKYYAYNPIKDKNVNTKRKGLKGDGWYSITKNTWNHSIKDANLNPNTGEYETWWHEGGIKDGNITNETVLSYLRDNDLSELIKGT